MNLKKIPTTSAANSDNGPDLAASVVSKSDLKALRADQSTLRGFVTGSRAGKIAADLELSVRGVQADEKLRAYQVVLHDTTDLLIGKHKQLVGKQFAAIEQDNRVSADMALQRAGNFTVHARSRLEVARAVDLQMLNQEAAAGHIRPDQLALTQVYANATYDYVSQLQQDGFVGSVHRIKDFYDGASVPHPVAQPKESP